jgi:CheY-like chemotaxis protein
MRMTADVKRILLVEDNQNDIDLTLAALDENHLADEVIVVRDGEQALDYLYRRGNFRLRASGDPAVVLLDLKLPKIDGLEVLSQVKADPQLKSIPIVMLTLSRQPVDLGRSYQRGVNAYVVKPVTFSQFVEALRELGVFWAEINEPPPGTVGRKNGAST